MKDHQMKDYWNERSLRCKIIE